MPSINIDAYPLATPEGIQIRPDIIRPIRLNSIAVPLGTGSPVNTTKMLSTGLYKLYATQDCIVDFTGVATVTLADSEAIFIRAGSSVLLAPTQNHTGISAIGITTVGTLYIQELVEWAGVANSSTLENQ